MWEYAQSQTAGDPLIAAVASCEGLKAGEPFGLTALFAVSGETGISRDEVLRTAETIMSVTNTPLHMDAVRFVDDSIRRFIETAETDIGAYRYNDIYIQVGTNKRRDSLFTLGMTPLRDMVLRSLPLFPITDENNLGAFLWVHGELLSSVRRHTPGLSLDD